MTPIQTKFNHRLSFALGSSVLVLFEACGGIVDIDGSLESPKILIVDIDGSLETPKILG